MPRQPRIDFGDHVYHVINRANARVKIFETDKDYLLFEELLEEAKELIDMRILSYCIMPNHWHLVLYPIKDGDLAQFMKWLTTTHTRKWHVAHKTIGSGHLYQGRYKSFLVQEDSYFMQLCRYVERNPLRAKLVERAEDWRWSSLWRREEGTTKQKKLLSEWLIPPPANYLAEINEKEEEGARETIRGCISKGKPFGNDEWVLDTIEKFDLLSTVRNPGRPKKGE